MHEAYAFDFADRVSCQHRDAGRREPPEGLTFPLEIVFDPCVVSCVNAMVSNMAAVAEKTLLIPLGPFSAQAGSVGAPPALQGSPSPS